MAIKNKMAIDWKNKMAIEKNNMAIDWKKFEQKNKTIALNILFVPHNTKIMMLAYKPKYNHKRKNQVVLLMITDDKNGIILLWKVNLYLTIKNGVIILQKVYQNSLEE